MQIHGHILNLKSLNGEANLKGYLLYDFTYMTFLKKTKGIEITNRSVVAGDVEQWVGLGGIGLNK